MKITKGKGEHEYVVAYRGHTFVFDGWNNELEAAGDALSALVGLPVKVARSDAGGWQVTVDRLRWECPDCRLVHVADNVVWLSDGVHRAIAAQHKQGTGGYEAPKRNGLLWAPQTRLPKLHRLGKETFANRDTIPEQVDD